MIIKLKSPVKLEKTQIPAESVGKVTSVKFGDGKTLYRCVFGEIEVELMRKDFSFSGEK
jgi:hypothetical protein